MKDLVRWAWIGRPRAAVLVVLALASLVDLVSFVALVTGDDEPGPREVARQVVQAIADDDCSDLDDLLDRGDLPPVLTSCLDGTPSPVALSGVTVVGDESVDDSAAVTVGVEADGRPAEVVVVLRRDDDRWLVTGIRAE